LVDDAASGQADAVLLSLAFEQGVDKQGDQVDQEHGLDALIGVDMQGAHFQILLADFETFFQGIFLAVQGSHFRIRQVGVISDQEKPAITMFGGLQSIGLDPPLQADFPCDGGDLHADLLAHRRVFHLGGYSLADFFLATVAFLPDLALARRKRSFTGQKGYILLTDLAHNLLADFAHHGLNRSSFAGFGPKRIVRDLLNMPGLLSLGENQV